MRKSYFILLFFFMSICIGWATAFAQVRLPNADSVEMLIGETAIQIECTAGVNDLYNFKFRRAESQFQWLRRTYPKHPLPYFLMGLSQWWKIMPNINLTTYDEKLLDYMDSTIYYAEKIYDKSSGKKKVEAAFFLAGAYGFKGRLHSERQNWTKATFAGKKALNYMEVAHGNTSLSPELLFGDGLYNYYSVWVPENYPKLKPFLIFFKKGDKNLGLKQLQEATQNAFYTRTEAQYFLMRIYDDEGKRDKALGTALYLHTTFPDNAFFHRYYARMLYLTGDMNELEKECQDILLNIEQKMPGYEGNSGRYAAFFLGYVYQFHKKDLPTAKKYLEQSLVFAESVDAMEAGYYLHALSYLARIADSEKNIKQAKIYYQKIVDHADKKHPTKKEAKEYLKKYKKIK